MKKKITIFCVILSVLCVLSVVSVSASEWYEGKLPIDETYGTSVLTWTLTDGNSPPEGAYFGTSSASGMARYVVFRRDSSSLPMRVELHYDDGSVTSVDGYLIRFLWRIFDETTYGVNVIVDDVERLQIRFTTDGMVVNEISSTATKTTIDEVSHVYFYFDIADFDIIFAPSVDGDSPYSSRLEYFLNCISSYYRVANDFAIEDAWDDGVHEGYNSGYEIGISDGYSDGYSNGKDDGYSDGVSDGYVVGFERGKEDGYSVGYGDGVNAGRSDAVQTIDSTWDFMYAIFEAPYRFLKSFLNVTIFGINLFSIVTGIVAVVVVIFFLRLLYAVVKKINPLD